LALVSIPDFFQALHDPRAEFYFCGVYVQAIPYQKYFLYLIGRRQFGPFIHCLLVKKAVVSFGSEFLGCTGEIRFPRKRKRSQDEYFCPGWLLKDELGYFF
jgi:hypothetical protein